MKDLFWLNNCLFVDIYGVFIKYLMVLISMDTKDLSWIIN